MLKTTVKCSQSQQIPEAILNLRIDNILEIERNFNQNPYHRSQYQKYFRTVCLHRVSN